jgi:hypothetical protein
VVQISDVFYRGPAVLTHTLERAGSEEFDEMLEHPRAVAIHDPVVEPLRVECLQVEPLAHKILLPTGDQGELGRELGVERAL